jgi:methyl-accepting chemotaxis protein
MPESSSFLEHLKKRSKSVQFRIILWFFIIGSVPAIGIGLFALEQQSEVLKKEAFSNQEEVLSQKLANLQTYLKENKTDIKEVSGRFTLQNLIEAIPTLDQEEIDFWLEPVQEDFSRLAIIRKRFSQIQLIDLKGQEIIRVSYDQKKSHILEKESLVNIKSQPLFKSISSLQRDQVSVIPIMAYNGHSHESSFSEPVIQFGAPLFSPGGKKMGFLVITARARPMLKNFGNVSQGEIMLADATGYLLYHPELNKKSDWKTKQVEAKIQNYFSSQFYTKIKSESHGIIEDNGFISFQQIKYKTGGSEKIWLGIYSRDKDNVLKPVTEFRNQFIFIITLMLLFIFIVAGAFGNNLTRPLLKVVAAAKAIGRGDLRQEKLNFQSEDEIGVLANTFDGMVEQLQNNIHSISGTSLTLNSSSTQISAAVNEQSSIAAEQSASLTQITATLEELSQSSSQIASNSSSVVDISSSALGLSQKGAETIGELKGKMDGILENNKANIKDIISLGQKSKEIGAVMGIINNIADQTKLIAFNAAIEASGAGESGKRFGVVAVEIRRLADNVMESTNEIHSKIEEIQQAINRLVVVAEKGSKGIEEGADLASKTITELGTLVQGAKSTNDEAKQISISTQQQMTATSQVLSALKEIQTGIHQSSISMKQTQTITSSLAETSKDLKRLMSEFKIEKSK